METKGVDNNNMNITPHIHENPNPSERLRFDAESVAGDEGYFVELMLGIMKPLLRKLVQVEVKNAFQTQFHIHLQTLRGSKEMSKEEIEEGEIEKYKLVFWNEPSSIIFSNNEIKAENGEPLQVAILDVTTNAIINTGLLSSVEVEFFLVDGGSCERNHHPLSPRDGKRPLMVGNDLNLTLQNGVASIHSLSITDNSSWIKSKKFCLGVKIRDHTNLVMFSSIRIAVSQPFRVLDNRGEVNKKHHPPSREDEVWRLEGVGKDGTYHKNLSSNGIENVGDFLKAYHEKGPTSLKKLLGNKVPKKIWDMMVANAEECVNLPSYQQTSKVNEWPYNVLGDQPPFNKGHEVYEQIHNLGDGSSKIPGVVNFVEDFECGVGYGDFSSLFIKESLTPNTFDDMHKKKRKRKKDTLEEFGQC